MNEIRVAEANKKILTKLIAKNHYSGSCSSILVGLGVWFGAALCGGIVFSMPNGTRANAYCRVCRADEVLELSRLWLSHSLPKNSESRVVGIALRLLKKNRGRFKAVLSYADEYSGHIGTIYQACNFYYLGETSGSAKLRIGDKIYNSRSLSGRYATCSIPKLKEILNRNDICYVRGTNKHVYVYPLVPQAKEWLIQHCQPYPKRSKQASAEHPSACGGAAPTRTLQKKPT